MTKICRMKVGYKAGAYYANATPEIRLANHSLREIVGLEIGQLIDVEYTAGVLTIRKVETICQA